MPRKMTFVLDKKTWLRNSGEAPTDFALISSRNTGSALIKGQSCMCAGYQCSTQNGIYDWIFTERDGIKNLNDGYHATDKEKIAALRAAFKKLNITFEVREAA